MSPTILVDGVRRPTTNSEGKRIARTEEAVRNFWRWFRDSKVVDEQGRPRVMYHGTTSKSGFSEFRSGYFTSERERANSYTEDFDPFLYGTLDNVQAGVIYPVYVRLENPAVRPEGGAGNLSEIPNGRDGVMGLGRGGRGIVAVVSSPTQIKSATGNRGTFDLGDPVITNPGRVLQAEIPRIPDDYAVQAKLAALTDDELLTDKHFRLQDAQDEIRDRAIATIMAEQPFDGLVIPLREHAGTFAIVAPFVKQRGVKAWQATNFDARGPWTDTVARTIPELLRDIYLHYKADFHKTKVVRKR